MYASVTAKCGEFSDAGGSGGGVHVGPESVKNGIMRIALPSLTAMNAT